MSEDSNPGEVKSKLLVSTPEGGFAPFQPDDRFQHDTAMGVPRLFATTSKSRIDFLLQAASRYPGPYWITYVLEPEGWDWTPGRYHSTSHLTLLQVEYFLRRFADFIEQDSRHHIWVTCHTTGGIVVYDQHDYFVLYERLAEHEIAFRQQGLAEVQIRHLELTHAHSYYQTFNADFESLMDFYPWEFTPLMLSDTAQRAKNPIRRAWEFASFRLGLWRSRRNRPKE